MTYELVVKSIAEKDISEAVKWYINKDDRLGTKFLQAIDNSLEILSKNPKHYQKRYGEVRLIGTHKFPYNIYYSIEGNSIYVHAVLHSKQNPQKGIERL